MYMDDGTYRIGLNPQFVARVRRKRREEARQRIEAEKELIKEMANRKRDAVLKEISDQQITVPEKPILPNSSMSVRQIISLVAQSHGFTYHDIISKGRKYPIVVARQDAMRCVKTLKPFLSYPKIGKFFDRDHTTVLHACGRLKAKKTKDGYEWPVHSKI